MRSAALILLLLGVTLSGCFGGNEVATPDDVCEDEQVLCDPEQYFGDHFCEKNDVRPRIYAPDTKGPDSDANPWVIGDYWEYSLKVNDEDLGKTKLVYYAIQDQGAHYMAGTPTREEALQHALFSTNPVIGRVHRTLYSPHESGSHADMFLFPLCQGSTWKDTFFGTEFTFRASRQTINLPDGSSDPLGFLIKGTATDGSRVEHTYSPMAKWFTAIHLDRADGESVDMDLTDTGSGYKGKAYFLRGQKDESFDLSTFSSSRSEVVVREDGKEGPYDKIGLHIDVERTEGTGRVDVRIMDPGGNVAACMTLVGSGPAGGSVPAGCSASEIIMETAYLPGDWTVEVQLPVLGGTRISGDVRLVSIYDRSGTA